jgi:hypothetical protein
VNNPHRTSDPAAAQTGASDGLEGPPIRVGRSLSLAKTLQLACVLGLVAFVGFVFVSLLSNRSIDKSFDAVTAVDQPRLEAATDMDSAADEATIAFLESLVTSETVPFADADVEFDPPSASTARWCKTFTTISAGPRPSCFGG